MHAMQCEKCHARDQVPQMRVREPQAKE